MDQSKETHDDCASGGMGFGATDIRASLVTFMKLDHGDLGSPEMI